MLAKTHIAKLPEDWKDQFLKLYDSGGSDWELMRIYGITPGAWKTMYNALGESEFHEVVEFGNVLAKAWWIELGRKNVYNKQFNTRLYDITMQNRFGWAQKAETTENESPIGMADDATLDRRLEQLKENKD